MATMPDGYYNRFDASKRYDAHLFRAGKTLQSAELNELQSASTARLKDIADVLFKDGDVIRDGQVSVNAATGAVQCQSGAVYLRGSVRGVAPASLTIPVVGTVAIGICLTDSVVTEVEDVDLRDPAVGLRNYREPGAHRLKTLAVWASDQSACSGDFYPVYYVDDGYLRAKEAPPSVDLVSLALAKYDRDSAGGTYIVSGLSVSADADVGGNQVYILSEGRARCYGFAIEQQTSKRITYDAQPYARAITSEPHTASGGTERITTNYHPIAGVSSVIAMKEVSNRAITHGAYLGVSDPIGETSVASVSSISSLPNGAGTVYHSGTDYNLSGDTIDWSPSGAEPATGSTYYVTFRYLADVTPGSHDATGFEVTGAVSGSSVLVTYSYYMPRIDRLCLNRDGAVVWVRGTPADWNPWPPEVSRELLPVAKIYQTWDDGRMVIRDGARTVPMDELAQIQSKLDRLISLTAQERLRGDANLRDASLKKSIFVDPLQDDSMRDQGLAQTGAVYMGVLTLPISVAATRLDDVGISHLSATPAVLIEQPLRTGSMKVNPYLAFAPAPASVALMPAVDRWTSFDAAWAASQETRTISIGQGVLIDTRTEIMEVVLQRSTVPDQYLRQIEVAFTASGFGPNEVLQSVTFDGLAVTVTP
jgi:hypothetical protein